MFDAAKLAGFFADLRSNGYQIGIAEQTKIAELLIKLKSTNNFPNSSDQFARIIAPVLCNSIEQQIHFPKKFESHFGRWKEATNKPSLTEETKQTNTLTEIVDDTLKSVVEALTRTRQIDLSSVRSILSRFFILLTLVTSLFAVSTLIVSLMNTNLTNLKLPTIDIPEQRDEHKDGAATQNYPMPPSLPNVKRINEMTAAIWENAKGFIGPMTVLSYAERLGVWGIFLLSLPLALAVLWIVAPGVRLAAYLRRRHVVGRPAMVSLFVEEPSFNPFVSMPLSRHYQTLRRPVKVPSDQIDTEKSLYLTAMNGGLFTPVMAQKFVAPEYLILIDRQNKDDHVGRFAESLLKALDNSQVYSDVYYFNSDFRRVFKSYQSASASFEEVAGRCADHRLILITNGTGLFRRGSGEVAPWAEDIKQFSTRLILTPVPIELWGYREKTLAKQLSLPVFRLAPETVPEIAEFLAFEMNAEFQSTNRLTGSPSTALQYLSDLLSDRPLLWLASARPSGTAIEDLICTLRDALGPSGFNWLSSCAVYPELQWNLTLHLGMSLRDNLDRPILDNSRTDRLLFLSILPWFRAGSMPGWLRAELVETMDERRYTALRDLLRKLLQVTFRRHRDATDLKMSDQTRNWMDRSKHDALTEHRDDPLLIDLLSRRNQKKTSFMLPDNIAQKMRFMRSGGLIRNLTSQVAFEEAEMNAGALHDAFDESGVTWLSTDDGFLREFGPDFKHIAEFKSGDGSLVNFDDGFVLFLPVNGKDAHVVDIGSAEVLTKRRKTRTLVALINILVSAIFLLSFHRLEQYNTAAEVIISGMVLVVPFALFHALVVARYAKYLRLFPKVEQVGDGSKLLATEFRRK